VETLADEYINKMFEGYRIRKKMRCRAHQLPIGLYGSGHLPQERPNRPTNDEESAEVEQYTIPWRKPEAWCTVSHIMMMSLGSKWGAGSGSVSAYRRNGDWRCTRPHPPTRRHADTSLLEVPHWPTSRILRKRTTPKITAIMISVTNMMVARADP
jgi:hypothetical protein